MTPDEVDEWAAWMRSRTIVEFQQEGHLQASVFLLVEDPKTGLTGHELMSPVDMDGTTISIDAFVQEVRDTYAKRKALAVCFFSQMLLRGVSGNTEREALVFSYERAELRQVWVALVKGKRVTDYRPSENVLIPNGLSHLIEAPVVN